MKLRIHEIYLKNFLSIGNDGMTVSFQDGLYRVKGVNEDINDPNGVGKCVDGDTIVNIDFLNKDVEDLFLKFLHKEISRITVKNIVDFYKSYPDLKGNITVKTPYGYKRILEAKETDYSVPVSVVTENRKSVICSKKHRFKIDNKSIKDANSFKCIKDLAVGDYILTETGEEKIIAIHEFIEERFLYDFQVEEVEQYYTNGIVSHNSSIYVDGLMFSLFGKTVRTINKEDIANTINGKKKCETRIKFSIGPKNYTIHRNIKPDNLILEKEGEPILQQCSSKLIQQEINKILGADFNTFSHILIMSKSYTSPFLDMSGPDKRGVIEDILGVSIFGKMREHIKKEVDKTLNVDLKIKKTEYETLLETYEDLKRRNDTIKDKISKMKEEKQQKIETLKEKYSVIKKQLTKQQELVIDTDTFQTKIKKLKELKKKNSDKKNELTTEIKSIIKTNEGLQKKLEKLKESPVCPLCDTETNSDHIVDHIEEMTTDIEKGIFVCEENKAELVLINDNIDKIDVKVEELESKIKRSEQAHNSTCILEEKKQQVYERLDELIKQEEIYDDFVDETSLKEKETQLNELYNELNLLSKERAYYDFIKDILSDEGIKNYIVKTILPFWNKQVNTYLKEVNADFVIEFDSQMDAIIKSRGLDPLSYHSFSGGEKARIDFAILMSMMDLASARSALDLNVTVLDELLDGSGLSTNAKEDVLKLLRTRADSKDKSIYVISHHDTLNNEIFTDEINLVKRNGFTSMV